MKGLLVAFGVLWTFALVTPVMAQTASPTSFEAGDLLVRLRADEAIPQNFSSSVALQGSNALSGSTVHVTSAPAAELDFSYFFTPHVSVEAIFGTTHHYVSANTPLGHIDVGSFWALPPVVTLQYHFPEFHGFIPYAGVGVAALIFYDVHSSGGGLVHSLYVRDAIGPALEAGVDYQIASRWYLNFVVKQTFVSTTASINHGEIFAKDSISPTIVGFGVGMKF
jgi:outer membrane protein